MPIRFQFLIGTLKTRKCSYSIGPNGVSIPHRYAKNKPFANRASLILSPFQFLIGTLKTCSSEPSWSRFITFQFLIGTLKTGQKCSYFCFRSLFQFLIGTLKTPVRSRRAPLVAGVSIPHRYAKNCCSQSGLGSP